MDIIYRKKFANKLANFCKFIRKDKPNFADKFKNDLLNEIKNLTVFPFINKIFSTEEDENIRVMIYKGYKIVYYVDIPNDQIIIITFLGQEEVDTI